MRKKLLFACHFLLFSLLSTLSFAQNASVSGRVTDPNGKPVAGATITGKGTTQAAVTDENGNFSISVPKSINRTAAGCSA